MIDGAYATAGALTGLAVGLTGVGGGALMTSILLLFFGIAPATAIGTDLWFAAVTKVIGARVHHKAGLVDWPIARLMWAGSLPAALLTAILIHRGILLARPEWLAKAIGIVVLITAIGLFLAPQLAARTGKRTMAASSTLSSAQPTLTITAGAVVGLCVALTSIGAGTLGSVALMYLYPERMTPHRLIATDIVHAIPLAVVAGSGYLFAGAVDGSMLMSLLTGSIPAVVAGSLLARKCSGRGIQLVLAMALMMAAAKILT
jgi:uncharacterized protein